MIDEGKLSSLLLENITLRPVEPHIYSVYPREGHTNTYDRIWPFYDLVMGNRYYNRILWGYRIADYSSFCHDSLASSSDGWVLDAGCGSLVFTSNTYAGYSKRPVVLLDASLQMLRAAKSRLSRLNGNVPANMAFLHGDVLQLPFKPGSFRTILSMNVLHVLPNINTVLSELKNALADGGTIALTSLIANDRFGDLYPKLLSKTGQLIPRTPDQILACFEELEISTSHYVRGNMMFIHHV